VSAWRDGQAADAAQFAVEELGPHERRRAQLTVVRQSRDVDEARELLAMLGLLGEPGPARVRRPAPEPRRRAATGKDGGQGTGSAARRASVPDAVVQGLRAGRAEGAEQDAAPRRAEARGRAGGTRGTRGTAARSGEPAGRKGAHARAERTPGSGKGDGARRAAHARAGKDVSAGESGARKGAQGRARRAPSGSGAGAQRGAQKGGARARKPAVKGTPGRTAKGAQKGGQAGARGRGRSESEGRGRATARSEEVGDVEVRHGHVRGLWWHLDNGKEPCAECAAVLAELDGFGMLRRVEA
jgi:hypothetical protein